MTAQDYAALASQLTDVMGLDHPPLAITFSQMPPQNVSRIEGDMPEPTADGRTGSVPAGCVFWVKAQERTFTTTAEDHANCSVGSVTHGFKTPEDVADQADVKALIEARWVSPEILPEIPALQTRPAYVTYGPLSETSVEPHVIFLRLHAKQVMVLSDAMPDLQFEGKPQCHIIPLAKEQNKVAVSVGCMLSRVRTGIPNTEMTCAIPASRLEEVIDRLKQANAADKAAAAYASDDARRFS